MKTTNTFMHAIVACLISVLTMSSGAAAEPSMVRKFSVYDLQTAEAVNGLKKLRQVQSVEREQLPDQAGIRVAVRGRKVFKYLLHVNGERVRRLRGTRRIALARRNLGLSAEWDVVVGDNEFVATAVFREPSKRRLQRKSRTVRVIRQKGPKQDPTPTATPIPSLQSFRTIRRSRCFGPCFRS
jgi:hypothetical protein